MLKSAQLSNVLNTYLLKYCYKGHDCAFIKISNIDVLFSKDATNENGNNVYDEIKQYINT